MCKDNSTEHSLKILDCRFVVVSTKNYLFGGVVDGVATGYFAHLAAGNSDFAIGSIYVGMYRAMVSRITTHILFGEAYTMATPIPVPKRYFQGRVYVLDVEAIEFFTGGDGLMKHDSP